MREIRSHKSAGLNNRLDIIALDEHLYEINLGSTQLAKIQFQTGLNFNGISNESLLAIVEDRLLNQGGDYSDVVVLVRTAMERLNGARVEAAIYDSAAEMG